MKITFGPFCLVQDEGTLWRRQERLPLRPKSAAILAFLVQNPGRIVTREELLNAVWPGVTVDEGVVKAAIKEIRRALGDSTESPQFIETLRSRGYRFIGSMDVGNLPSSRTTFVGRSGDIRVLKQRLKTTRLLTLHGPPGVGKTCLAIRLASHLRERMPHGVWFIDIATVSDSGRVGSAVAAVFEVHEKGTLPLIASLAEAIGERRLLLVFDNCEHLVESCASVASELLRRCPNLTILATSRQPLRIPGETVWTLSELSTPDLAAPQGEWLESEAVQLFLDRARDASSTFTISDRNAKAIALICRHLDGMPLAIELAAARVRALSPETIAAHLDDVFAVLGKGNRSEPPRHQTLTAALDWSFDLLSPSERLLFQRLSVFAGNFTLSAVESVCSGFGVDAAEALDLMTSLVDHALVKVIADAAVGEMRYRFLYTIRQYAHRRLSSEFQTPLARRYAEFFLSVAEEHGPRADSDDRSFACLSREAANLYAALEWAQKDSSGSDLGLRLAVALCPYWGRTGQLDTARYWLEQMRDRNVGATTELKARVLSELGGFARLQGDFEVARNSLEESVALWRAISDPVGLGKALNHLGAVTANLGDVVTGERFVRESLEALRSTAPTPRTTIALALKNLAEIERLKGSPAGAVRLLEESVRVLDKVGTGWLAALPLGHLGKVAADLGAYEQAEEYWHQCITRLEPLEGDYLLAYALGGLAYVASVRKDAARAARLLGAAEHLRGTLTDDPWFLNPPTLAMELRNVLGLDEFERCRSEGLELSRRAAINEGLGPCDSSRAGSGLDPQSGGTGHRVAVGECPRTERGGDARLAADGARLGTDSGRRRGSKRNVGDERGLEPVHLAKKGTTIRRRR